MRRNPTPYTLPVIPQPFPSDIVEGEHFVIADLRRLISSSARSSGGLVVEASSLVQGAGSASSSSTSPSEDSSSPLVVTIKRKEAAERRSVPGSKGKDFVPWVSTEHKDFQDLNEEEREERMTGLLDCYATHKRKRQLSSGSESDIAPTQATGPS